MFYVGAFVSYSGAEKAKSATVRKIEKLGHSIGRGERFLKSHPPQAVDGMNYRAMVLVLPSGFILNNEAIRTAIRAYRCDWDTAKFHCYRLSAVNVLGKQDVWQDVLTAANEAEAKLQSTATAPEPVLEGNTPIVNPDIDRIIVE